jgi:two-component system NarL family sensor kinase
MTEARRNEQMLRALAHRIVQVQEAERGSVALELHNNITQVLCAVLFSIQALVEKVSGRNGAARREVVKLRALISHATAEVERIAQNLRPSILDQLGLRAALQATCAEFATRIGIVVTLTDTSADDLPPASQLAVYRIVQEALGNVARHAHARHVSVQLHQTRTFVRLVVNDDGDGFDSAHHAARLKGRSVLGFVGMRERAAFVGGTLIIKSGLRAGTEIAVQIPWVPPASARPEPAAPGFPLL